MLNADTVILIADDDSGHARLIQKNLQRAGIRSRIRRFVDGEEILKFLLDAPPEPCLEAHCLLLLDIRMPKIDGVEVLRRLKAETKFRKLPVIMLTTTDDPKEVARCHALGCNNYLVKPVDYEKFSEAIKQLGAFIEIIQLPKIALRFEEAAPHPSAKWEA